VGGLVNASETAVSVFICGGSTRPDGPVEGCKNQSCDKCRLL